MSMISYRSPTMLWFDRIHGGSVPHNMAPNAWDFFGLCSAPNDHTFWVLGVWNRWKSPRHDVGKCHGFPRARLPLLTHNMARPPKTFLPQIFGSVREKSVAKSVAPHYLAEPFSSALKPGSESEAFFCHISWRQAHGSHTRAKRGKKATPRYVAGQDAPLYCIYKDFGGIGATLSGGNPP